MRTRDRGFTLVEIVFVCGLFSLVLLLVFRALDNIVPYQRKLSGQVERLREGAVTLGKLQRELRTTALVHWPAGAWVTHTPDLLAGNGPLMFVKNRPPDGWRSGDVISYWHDPVRNTVTRTGHQGAGFVFGTPSTYIPLPNESMTGRVLARGVESFTLRNLFNNGTNFMAIELTVEGVAEPLTARVRRLPGQGL